MKLVRENINFKRGLDPAESMGTRPDFIKEAIAEIYQLDKKNHFIYHQLTPGNIMEISTGNETFSIYFFSDDFLHPVNERLIVKKDYAIHLVKKAGILEFFKDVHCRDIDWNIIFIPEDSYRHFFIDEHRFMPGDF